MATALLAPLGNYGGPTQTMPPLPGSPVIDAGSNALVPEGVTTDQRGPGFPRIVNGVVDIGAFESQGFTLAVVSGDGQSAQAATAFANPLIVVLMDGDEPVPGASVTFTVEAGQASFNGSMTASATTDASGQASILGLTAGTRTGSIIVEAQTTGGATQPVSFTLSSYAGPVASYSFAPVGTDNAPGQSFDLTVTPIDAFGNLFPIFPSSNTILAFTSSDSHARLPGPFTVAQFQDMEGENGSVTFTGVQFGSSGVQTIDVTQDGVPPTAPTPLIVNVENFSPVGVTASISVPGLSPEANPPLVVVGHGFTISGSFQDPFDHGGHTVTLTVGPNDPIAVSPHTLSLAADVDTFSVFCAFNVAIPNIASVLQGITVTVTDAEGSSGSAPALRIYVENEMVQAVPSAKVLSVPPGTTRGSIVFSPGGTASLQTNGRDNSYVVVANDPTPSPVPTLVTTTYDVRGVNLSEKDVLTLTLPYFGGSASQVTVFVFNPVTGAQEVLIVPTGPTTPSPWY